MSAEERLHDGDVQCSFYHHLPFHIPVINVSAHAITDQSDQSDQSDQILPTLIVNMLGNGIQVEGNVLLNSGAEILIIR